MASVLLAFGARGSSAPEGAVANALVGSTDRMAAHPPSAPASIVAASSVEIELASLSDSLRTPVFLKKQQQNVTDG
jgi:hypothetical protein